jgi:hypothetical protein
MQAIEEVPLWVPVLVASVPAVASVMAAVIAGLCARRARIADAEAARLRELEQRLASTKYDVYQPMIELFRDVLDLDGAGQVFQEDVKSKTAEFSTWITILAPTKPSTLSTG